MASFKKFKRNQVNYVLKHNNRSMHCRDSHVDYSLTYLNYNLAPERTNNYLTDLLVELNCSKRQNINVAADLIVTIPEKMMGDRDKEYKFFNELYKYFTMLYKEKNIISAYVHYDEPGARPHMHLVFVPTVYDRKKKKPAVSYDKCVYKRLGSFHTKLSEYFENIYGYDIGILNGSTKDGNKTIEQLKEETRLQKEIETLRKERERAMSLNDKVILAEYKKRIDELEKDNRRLLKALKCAYDYMRKLNIFDKFIEIHSNSKQRKTPNCERNM